MPNVSPLMYSLYSVLVLALAVIASPWFVYQALRYKKYVGSLGQRMGYLPVSFNMDADESIWIHAVSVGEVLTARPLISDLKRRYPDLRMFLSTTTLAGQQLARRSVQDVDAVFYFPFDLGIFVRRTLDLVRPRLFIMMETEIWPNLLRECRARGVKTAVVNGRLSSRSFPRYRMVRAVHAPRARARRSLLRAERRVGAPLHRPRRRPGPRGGDRQPEVRLARRVADGAAGAGARSRAALLPPAGVAAGDRRRQHDEGRGDGRAARIPPRARHRAEHAAGDRAAQSRAVRRGGAAGARRRAGKRRGARDLAIDAEPRVDVVVLDTIGELATVYQVGTVVFVGGSLVATGGHNVLEPAVFGKPIVFGPHMENFAEIADAFVSNGAGVQVGERAASSTKPSCR